jgi:hypothetical protein
MAKTIFITPSIGMQAPEVAAAIQEAVKLASSLGNERIDIIGAPTSLPGLPYRGLLREQVRKADVFLADLSSTLPNVLMELGFAEALDKPVLVLAQDPDQIPMPRRDHQALLYQSPSSIHLGPRLQEALSAILSGSSTKQGGPASVFISYSHADSQYLDRILVHLRPLERNRLVECWSDRKIRTGDQWLPGIRDALKEARVAVLLISADFLASDFITANELPQLLASARDRGTRILPILVKPSRFIRDTALSGFQAFNSPERTISKMSEPEREELYAKLAEEIEMELAPFRER